MENKSHKERRAAHLHKAAFFMRTDFFTRTEFSRVLSFHKDGSTVALALGSRGMPEVIAIGPREA